MLRSMYSGISGMKVNQIKLDVIGNNIANVGTTAFKSQRTTFSDMLSQSVSNAQAPGQTQGGINAAQVGLGVQLASIDSVMTNGNLQSTGRLLDVAIDKSGYFVVSGGPTVNEDNIVPVTHTVGTHTIEKNALSTAGIELMYSRDGAFVLDNEGNLLTGDGYRVMGYSLTNDDSSKEATKESSSNVSAAGLDFMFGPGSQLNQYKVVLGSIGPNTVTNAEINKEDKTIVLSADFSNTGSLSTEQVQSAISKALTIASISQQVTVTGTPITVDNLGSESIKGGSDALAPKTVVFGGFTLSLSEGAELNDYIFQVGNVDTSLGVVVNSDPDIKTITVNGDFINAGVLSSTKLKEEINTQLELAGITQTVKSISGAPQNLTHISAKSGQTTIPEAPKMTDENGIVAVGAPATSDFGGFSVRVDTTSGYAAGLNGYTLRFGDTSVGTACSAVVDKATKEIRVNGEKATLTSADVRSEKNLIAKEWRSRWAPYH